MKKWISIVLSLSLLLSALPLFSVAAVDETDNNKMALLSALEIMSGDPDGNFRLEDSVSRAEFAKIAVAASQYKDLVAVGAPVSPFSDVPYTHWAAPYVQLAVNNGIVKGYTDATFRPDGTVLYEEAVTMLLNLLGYSDSDFGLAWPYGQMATAKSLGLTDNVTASVGAPLNRRDAMTLVYQLLKTPTKTQGTDYITTLGYTWSEDVVLIATSEEEVSVGAGKILTSSGTYRMADSFDRTQIGRRGDVILENRDTLKVFLPDEQKTENYSVYQVLSDDVMVMKNGTLSKLGMGKSLTVYYEGRSATLSSLLSTLSVGDGITVYKDAQGTPDYAVVSTDNLVGPITVTGSNWLASTGLSNPEVMKNGTRVTLSDITTNDVIYYSTALNRVFAYRKQVTGVYEKALPNRDQPTSIVVSGTTYAIEGASALEKLSSGGSIGLGESVTLLLGKSDEVADVMTPQGSLVGYLTRTGTKSYETGTTVGTYSGYYAAVTLPDGESYEYITDKDYESYINRVVTVRFGSDGTASISRYNTSSSFSGTVSAAKSKIGSKTVAADVEILDVSTTDSSKTGLTTRVYLARLDGITLNSEKVLYVKTNDLGQISQLILENQTGDMYDYVLITKATETADPSLSGQYTYLSGGIEQTARSSSALFGIKGRTGAQMTISNAGVERLTALSRIDSGITEVTASKLVANGKEYLVSDRVEVYQKNSQYEYSMVPISEVSKDSGNLIAYYDKDSASGGRIRIIVIE